MGSDKARHAVASGAEVLVAGDASCLLHVGGLLARQRAGVRTMHLAEVLASTEGGTGGTGTGAGTGTRTGTGTWARSGEGAA